MTVITIETINLDLAKDVYPYTNSSDPSDMTRAAIDVAIEESMLNGGDVVETWVRLRSPPGGYCDTYGNTLPVSIKYVVAEHLRDDFDVYKEILKGQSAYAESLIEETSALGEEMKGYDVTLSTRLYGFRDVMVKHISDSNVAPESNWKSYIPMSLEDVHTILIGFREEIAIAIEHRNQIVFINGPISSANA